MNIKLVVVDWVDKNGESIYHTEEGISISSGNFHSGTTFDAILHVSQEEKAELLRAFSSGNVPVFRMTL